MVSSDSTVSTGHDEGSNGKKFLDPSSDDSTCERHILAERFKTKLCQNYEATGACQYGSRCMFAHGCCDLRTYEDNMRDRLFTEEAISAWRRAIRLIERSKNAKTDSVFVGSIHPPLPSPPSYDASLTAIYATPPPRYDETIHSCACTFPSEHPNYSTLECSVKESSSFYRGECSKKHARPMQQLDNSHGIGTREFHSLSEDNLTSLSSISSIGETSFIKERKKSHCRYRHDPYNLLKSHRYATQTSC